MHASRERHKDRVDSPLSFSASKKKQIHIFAKSRNIRHNKSINNRDERKDDYGIGIHNAGRLSDTGSGAVGGRDAYRQIWDVAQDIPVFCKNFLQKVASNFCIVLQLHFT